jgi:hypothetical protein
MLIRQPSIPSLFHKPRACLSQCTGAQNQMWSWGYFASCSVYECVLFYYKRFLLPDVAWKQMNSDCETDV